jgi:hypothetical protein
MVGEEIQMRQYHIYLIKTEFAEHFFGQEYKLFELFLQSRGNHYQSEQIARKQASFVIGKIDTIHINHSLTKHFTDNKNYSVLGNTHLLYGETHESFAKCTIKEDEIQIEASGSFEAETTFFEVLRKQSSHFLAMDFYHERYGWLNPVKQKTYMS